MGPLLSFQTHISKETRLQAQAHTVGLFPPGYPAGLLTLQGLQSFVIVTKKHPDPARQYSGTTSL